MAEPAAVGVAHGKLVLCGEHAVVHGHPAIAFAVDRTLEVALFERPGPTGPTDDAVSDPRLARALRRVLPESGLGVRIRTRLPVGRGMGSSAALAVALVRASAALEGRDLDDDAVFERAFEVERVFHGTPSGMDHAVAARGGALLYRRGPPVEMTPLPAPAGSVVVLDSGVAGDTGAMVAAVAARRPAVDGLLARIGGLVERARGVLDDPGLLGPLLTENHSLLRGIGVSTPQLDALVDLALDAGALGAKLAGAGGGGVVLALCDDTAPLLDAARRADVPAFACNPAG